MKNFVTVALLLATALLEIARADTLIGTFEINYLYNAAGCSPTGGPNDGNPYHCPSPIPPGPHFINAAPGRYRVVVTGFGAAGPAVASIWNGDANGGTRINTPQPGNIGDSKEFDHKFGQIVLYYWDWYVPDNSPTISTTVELYVINPPTIHIDGVSASDFGSFSRDMLPFCSGDALRCKATMANADGLTVQWSISGINSGDAVPSSGPGIVTAGVGTFVFDIESLPPLLTAVFPRDGLHFTVTATLSDGPNVVATDSTTIIQSDLGELRQEYVDHSIHVPDVSEFNRDLRKSLPQRWNDGDYDWAIISTWAVQTDAGMNATAVGIIPAAHIPLQVNSAYRNPCKHWRAYLADGLNPPALSLHQYGEAIDYQVFDWDGAGSAIADWELLHSVALLVPSIPTGAGGPCFAGGIEKRKCSGTGHLHVDSRQFP